MFFPVSFNFKLLATLLLFYIPVTCDFVFVISDVYTVYFLWCIFWLYLQRVKSEISFNVKTVFWQCMYRQ